eukprot:gene7097-9631_t
MKIRQDKYFPNRWLIILTYFVFSTLTDATMQQDVWYSFNTGEYLITSETKTFSSAVDMCPDISSDAYAVHINDKAEFDFVASLVQDGASSSRAWVGLRKGLTWSTYSGDSSAPTVRPSIQWFETGCSRLEHGSGNPEQNLRDCRRNSEQIVCERTRRPISFSVGNFVFRAYFDKTTYDKAGSVCRSWESDAYLTRIENPNLQDFVLENIETVAENIWIGIRMDEYENAHHDMNGRKVLRVDYTDFEEPLTGAQIIVGEEPAAPQLEYLCAEETLLIVNQARTIRLKVRIHCAKSYIVSKGFGLPIISTRNCEPGGVFTGHVNEPSCIPWTTCSASNKGENKEVSNPSISEDRTCRSCEKTETQVKVQGIFHCK